VQIERTEADQKSESEASVKIFESKEILDGINAKIEDVKFETKLRATEKVTGVFEKSPHNLLVLKEEQNREKFDDEKYINKEMVKNAMKSEYVNAQITDNDISRNHINTNTMRNDREVYIHMNPSQSEESDIEDENIFYKCDVEHQIKVTLSDEWRDERILKNTFSRYQEARHFYSQIKQLKSENVELTHNGSRFRMKTQIGMVSDNKKSHLKISSYKNSILAGFGLGLIASLVGLGPISTLFIVSFILFLDHFQAHEKQKQAMFFYLNDCSDNNGDIIDIDKLRDYSISSRFVEKFNINISDNKTELNPESIQTKWEFDKVSDMLPNKSAIKFFDSIGLEKLDDDEFTAVVEHRSTIPEDKECVKSVCGQWYLYPKEEFEDWDNI
jgi:hypothetical protein